MSVMLLKTLLGLVGLVFVLFIFLALKSQKGQAPGVENGRLKNCEIAPNCVCSEVGNDTEHSASPLSGTMAQARDAILKTGGTIITESDDYISATYMSKIFKFVDDVELRADGKNQVQIRSASRVGYSDQGMNRKRVKAIRKAMTENTAKLGNS